MPEILTTAILAAAIAALVANLLVPPVSRFATALQALDHPGGRKLQREAVPRLGGLAIAAGLFVGTAGVAMMRWNVAPFAVSRSQLVGLGVATFLVFLVGTVDDVMGASAFKKFLAQIAAAYLVVYLDWSFQVVSLPGGGEVELGFLGDLISVLWIVGVTNAINLLDGLDGLAGGVVAIIAAGLLIFSLLQSNVLAVILMAAMVGACLGFLRHNWAPARIFMGDSGSLTLGFLLAVTSVHSSIKAPTIVAILVPLLALGLPVIDTLLVMRLRFVDRPHGRIFERFLRMFDADRNHLHHMLEETIAKRTRIVGWIYAAALAFCAMALVVALTDNLRLGLGLVAVEVLAVLGMRNSGRLRRRRAEGKATSGESGPGA